MELTNEQKSSYNIAMIIFYTKLAHYHAELCKQLQEVEKHESSRVRDYLNRYNYILNDIKLRLRTTSPNLYKDMFDTETAMFIGSIMHLACQIKEESRDAFEKLFEDLVLGKLELKQTKKGILLTETKTN